MKRQWRIVFFGWATLFTSSFLIAQQPTPYRVYTTDNGLINNTVYHIMQDPKGYIWMATAGGLSRFDGRNFSNYTTEKGLPSNEVFKVYYGSNHIWALTFNGLAYYDEGSDKFVFYDESKKLLGWLDKSVGVAGVDTLRTIFCIDKDFSLCKITKDLQFIRVLKDTINIMINSSNNDLCFLTQNYLYSYKIKEGKIEKIRPHLKALAFGAHGVQSDFEIYDNTLIARNKNANTIVKWKFNTDSVNILYDTRNINNAFFSKTQIIRFNNQPHLWVSTTDGIHIFDWKTQKRVLPKIELENVVQDVFYDREGNYWVATKGEGIYHYTNLNIKTWGKKEGLSHPNIDNLCYAPDGSIISVSSNFNLYLINAQGKLETKIDLEANGGELKKIALLGDDLYLLQMGKLIFLKNFLSVCRENKLNTRLSDFNPVTYPYNHKLKVINTKKSSISILENVKNLAFSEDKKKVYIIDNGLEIMKLDIESGKKDSLRFRMRANIYGLAEIEGKYLVFGGVLGLWRYNLQNAQIDTIYLKNIKSVILDITRLPNSYALVATNGDGLLLLKDTHIIKQWTKADGLISNACKKIVLSQNSDTAYIVTDAGIMLMAFRDKKDFNCPPQYIRTFGRQYSFPTFEINDISYNNQNHTLAVATRKGIASFLPEELTIQSVAPKLYLSWWKQKDNIPLSIKDVRIEHNDGPLRFLFSTPIFQNGANVVYQYVLKRGDEIVDTRDSTGRSELTYSDYSAGTHILEVRCRKVDEKLWSKTETISFEVLPKWWLSLPFKLLYFLLILTLIGSIAYYWTGWVRKRAAQRYEERSQRLQMEYKALLAQMNPHFTFNSLNALQRFFLSDKKEDTKKGIYALDAFGDLMRLTFENSELQLIPLSRELDFLEKYMDFVKGINDGTNRAFDYKIDASQVFSMKESIYLPPMLVQPLLENAHKFGIFSRSETNMILMTVNVEKGDLIFKIEDFGQGIKDDAENNPSGNRNRPNALRIIKERLALSKTPNSRNGTLILLNKKDMDETKQGTLAIIKIPINIQHETNN